MDIFIQRDELSRGLARVQGIIERRGTHPILSHVLLHAAGDNLRMTATDTEVAFIGDLPANVETDGQVAVDASNLFPVVRLLPEPTVQLRVTDNHYLEVLSGRSRYVLPGVAASEYPALPAFDGKGTIRVGEASLRRLVEQVAFAVAGEDRGYGLNGAHMESHTGDNDNRLRMVATDGHRLSTAEVAYEGDLALSPRTLVPRKALGIIRKLLDGGDEPVEVAFGDGAIRLSRPTQTFWFRLLDGDFPDYQSVVPSDHKYRIVVDRNVFLDALKRVAVLIRDRSRAVSFSFSAEELVIQVHNIDRGEVTESIPVEMEGGPITVGFNVRYLQDIAGVIQGDRLYLELMHPQAPCMVRDPEDETAFFVVMPMRLD